MGVAAVDEAGRMDPNDLPGSNVEEPSLEDALDGLLDAASYAGDIGRRDLAVRIARLYKEIGEAAPDEDWYEADRGSTLIDR